MSYIQKCDHCDETFRCYHMQGAPCENASAHEKDVTWEEKLRARLEENMQAVADYTIKVEKLEKEVARLNRDNGKLRNALREMVRVVQDWSARHYAPLVLSNAHKLLKLKNNP